MHQRSQVDVVRVRALLDNFEEETREVKLRLADFAKKLREACRSIEESWSGSCMGRHAMLYYTRFQRPSSTARFSVEWGLQLGPQPGWTERTVEEIEVEISRISSLNVKGVKAEHEEYHERLAELRDELLIELVGLQDQLGEIEAIKIDYTEDSAKSKQSRSITPKRISTSRAS